MVQLLFGLLLSQAFALEVVRPEFQDKIYLRIVRAEPDSFETYALTNHNGREMTLVCARNRVYDDNPQAMLRYRNFYGEEVGDFMIASDQVCREMGKFIESSSFGVDEKRPLLMVLSTRKLAVEKIIYPNVNPYSDDGDIEDLLPKKRVTVYPLRKGAPIKVPKVQ